MYNRISFHFVKKIRFQTYRSMSQQNVQNDVLFETHKSTGVMILNRPKQLNALNTSMVDKILNSLKDWSKTKKVIIVKGAGGKAFCAGGDVKAIAEAAHKGNYSLGEEFFTKEYRMNGIIGSLQLPYISLIDGITMGGGIGLSLHGPYRVATETTVFAMPETKIGFFPDVGGSYWMPRLPGYLGLYFGLTGDRLKGADVYHAGIATHFIERKDLEQLEKELIECTSHKDVKSVLDRFNKPTNESEYSLAPHLKDIASIFCEPTIETIVHRLNKMNTEWSNRTLILIQEQCPTSLKVAQKAYYKGRNLNLNQCLEMELQMAKYSIRSHNFYEGIRALLINKDNSPKWSPASIDEVTNEEVDAFFDDVDIKENSKI